MNHLQADNTILKVMQASRRKSRLPGLDETQGKLPGSLSLCKRLEAHLPEAFRNKTDTQGQVMRTSSLC